MLALVAAMCVSVGQGQEANEHKKAMRQKLIHALGAIEGVAFEGFDKSADRLLVLTQQAEWLVFDDAVYRQQSEGFRRAEAQVAAEARRKYVDGAAMGLRACDARVRQLPQGCARARAAQAAVIQSEKG